MLISMWKDVSTWLTLTRLSPQRRLVSVSCWSLLLRVQAYFHLFWQISNIVSVHAMEVCTGSRGIAVLILNLGTRWRWVVNVTPRPLYPWERSARYTLKRRLGGLYRVGLKNLNLGPVRSLVTVPTELPRLSQTFWHCRRYCRVL
jgi:hypothetical protein